MYQSIAVALYYDCATVDLSPEITSTLSYLQALVLRPTANKEEGMYQHISLYVTDPFHTPSCVPSNYN